jgi:hypothetical protein
MNIKQNNELECYEFEHEGRVSVYPYSLLFERIQILASELGEEDKLNNVENGSMKAYYIYRYFLQEVLLKYNKDGFQSKVYLVPELIGKEGKQVMVKYVDGTEETFFVGKKGTALPYYIKLETAKSEYGDPVQKHIESVLVIS